MPEAGMHKYYSMVARQRDVRLPWKIAGVKMEPNRLRIRISALLSSMYIRDIIRLCVALSTTSTIRYTMETQEGAVSFERNQCLYIMES